VTCARPHRGADYIALVSPWHTAMSVHRHTLAVREQSRLFAPGALRIAARFFDRSADTVTFKRGIDADNTPGFYRQLGKEPQELVKAALEVLAGRFSLG
jgi:hypothetical protein